MEDIVIRKRGNIEIIFLIFIITILILISFIIYILYTQIVSYIVPIKQDLFYIVQNAYFSLNQSSLEYGDYIMDNEKLKNKVNQVIKANYPKAKLISIYYDYNENKVHIEIMVEINPIVLKNNIKDIKLKIKDVIKLKTMEVKV